MNHHLFKLQRLKLMLCAGKETEYQFMTTRKTLSLNLEPSFTCKMNCDLINCISSINMFSTSRQFSTCDSPGLQGQHQHLLRPWWKCQRAVCIVALWINLRPEASNPYINKPSEWSQYLCRLNLNPQLGSCELISLCWSLELQSQYVYRQPRSISDWSAQGINYLVVEAFSPSLSW
jgi:hypothetical protein